MPCGQCWLRSCEVPGSGSSHWTLTTVAGGIIVGYLCTGRGQSPLFKGELAYRETMEPSGFENGRMYILLLIPPGARK